MHPRHPRRPSNEIADLTPHPPLERTMTLAITETAFARLDAEGRLFNSVLKGPTHKPGRFGFRGDIALKFQAKMADEARPPEFAAEQVLAVAHAGEPTIAFMAGYVLSFAYLKTLAEVMGDLLSPTGKYFFFVDNLDIARKYTMAYAGTTFHLLPIDESTVYNEMLQLLYIEKNDVKKLDTAGKSDYMADRALAFKDSYPAITYDACLDSVGPVRNPYENRPV
jgi:hypothetical protein